MQKTFALLVASTALTIAIGAPGWSATRAPADADLGPIAAVLGEGAQALPLVVASDDHENEHRNRGGSRRGHDDDDGGEDDECNDDRINDGCRGSARNPAPAGAVAPPRNGLFGNRAAPQVEVK